MYVSGWKNFRLKNFTMQLYYPTIRVCRRRREMYFNVNTCLRICCAKGPRDSGSDFLFGVQILGFGLGVCVTKPPKRVKNERV